MATKFGVLHPNSDINTNLLLVETWTFDQTSIGLTLVIGTYLALVLWILPQFMKKRQAYQLTNTLRFYNAFQVAFSAYAVFLVSINNCSTLPAEFGEKWRTECLSIRFLLHILLHAGYNVKLKLKILPLKVTHYWIIFQYTRYIISQGVITTRCPKGDSLRKVISEIWPYFIAKHVDLLDTVFFVLRKKDNQVTFLHVLHHALMVTWTWFHLMYHPTDHFVVVGNINSFVHVLMYAYYGIATLGPKYAKFIWWKKHLTKVQLVQFILVVTNLYYQQKLSPCPIPSEFHYFCLFSIISFFCLFINFYIRSYSGKKKIKETTVDIGCNNIQKNN